MTSKQVAPRSPICRVLVTDHVSVFHLQTKARRGEDFVRVRGGTAFEMVYKTFSSVGWNLQGFLSNILAPSMSNKST